MNFTDRLAGRLALVEHTTLLAEDSGAAELARRYGPRVAKLVAAGDDRAIRLVGLCEQRAAYGQSRHLNLNVLARYDRAIATLREELGLRPDGATLVAEMIALAISPGAFHSRGELQGALMEGLVLNVNTLAAEILSIPAGRYVVWATTPKTTMLVPTAEATAGGDEIREDRPANYDLHTSRLLGCWNKLQRVIGERKEDSNNPRAGLLNALDLGDKTQTEMADELGVDVSTVNRHITGKRNPSWKAMKGYAQHGVDPEDLLVTSPISKDRAYKSWDDKQPAGGGATQ